MSIFHERHLFTRASPFYFLPAFLKRPTLREEISKEARAFMDQNKIQPRKEFMAQAAIRHKGHAEVQNQLKLK